MTPTHLANEDQLRREALDQATRNASVRMLLKQDWRAGKDFGATLRAARALKGMSQSDLALQAGVAAAQISRYEANENMPRPHILAKLGAVLDLGEPGVAQTVVPPAFDLAKVPTAELLAELGRRCER